MKLRCRLCNTVIEGDKRGTFISCKCGAIAIDETKWYVRVIGNEENIEETEENNESITKNDEHKKN